MLDIKTMRAIGGLLARQARTRAVEPDVMSNEIIDLAPLLQSWQAGTASNVISYKVGDVRAYSGQIWKCVQAHDHHGEPGWEPGIVSMWALIMPRTQNMHCPGQNLRVRMICIKWANL